MPQKDLRTLKEIIRLTLGGGLLLATASSYADNSPCGENHSDTCLDRVIVIGPGPSNFNDLWTGFGGGPGPWEFDPDTGAVSHATGGTPPATFCALLNAQGAPQGCTRQWINDPTTNPYPTFQEPWQLELVFGANHVANWIYGYTTAALGICYSDIANDPLVCEANYSGTIRNICDIYVPDFNQIQPAHTDRELCHQGADEVDIRLAVTASDRAVADWFNVQISGFAVGPFSVAADFVLDIILSNQYNRALIEARRVQNCETFINAWDENNCGFGP